MLRPRRAPTCLLSSLNPIKPVLRRPVPAIFCLRHISRWNPASHPPRPKPPRRPAPEIPPDPKDQLPGWPEFKAELLKKCTNIDEVRAINELSVQEAVMLLDPELLEKQDKAAEFTKPTPINRNYFSGQPVLEQRVQDVEAIYEKYKHLPHAPAHLWAVREWDSSRFETDLDTSAGTYRPGAMKHKFRLRLVTLAKELNKIHTVLMPPALLSWLNAIAPLKQPGSAGLRQRRMLDKYRRSKGNGKRKTARAKVQVVPGAGQVYVNGKLAGEHFTRQKDVENVIWPLQALNVLGKYNVWVSTFGGGTTGQSEAAKLAVARAMLAQDTSGPQNLYRKLLRGGISAILLPG